MNKFELEHMISLADEKYIDEIFTDKIHNKKNKFLAGLGAAAAVLAVICGIGFISGKINNDADDLVADTASDSMLIDIIDEPVDYSQYFLNNIEDMEYFDNFSIGDNGGIYCKFGIEYTQKILPFTNDYNGGEFEGYTQLYFDYKDEVEYIEITLKGSKKENTNSVFNPYNICSIFVGKENSILSNLPYIYKCTPVKRLGADVYGTEFLDDNNGIINRFLIFSTGGRDYIIDTINMTYDEIGLIMDSIIKNGISMENYDLSQAFGLKYYDVNATISLAEANEVEPFAGCVPQLESIADMQFYEGVDYFAGRDIAHQLMPEYSYIYYTYYNGDDRDICIQYFTEATDIEPSENTLYIDNVTPGIFEHYMEDGNLFCTIECYGFKVNIWANNCTDDEIYIFKNALMEAVDAKAQGDPYRTLAEANEIGAFTGYIPQLDSVGDIPFNVCYYQNFPDGSERVVVTYYYPDDIAPDHEMPYINAAFESGGLSRHTFGDHIITIEDIADGITVHIVPEASEIEGCSKYSISVDCGGFTATINAECTSDEMRTYLSEIGKAYDGSKEIHSGKDQQVSLEYANEATAFSGFVPQLDSIGVMDVKYVTYNEDHIDGKPADSKLHIEYLPVTPYNYQFIIAEYQENIDLSDAGSANIYAAKIEELTEDMAKITAGIATDPEDNFYRFAIQCGEFYICITAECPEETMREYFTALKAAAANAG